MLVVGTGATGLRAIGLAEGGVQVLCVCVCALERRESRGAHTRRDYPGRDPLLRVNLVWDRGGGIAHERLGEPSAAVAALAAAPKSTRLGGSSNEYDVGVRRLTPPRMR